LPPQDPDHDTLPALSSGTRDALVHNGLIAASFTPAENSPTKKLDDLFPGGILFGGLARRSVSLGKYMWRQPWISLSSIPHTRSNLNDDISMMAYLNCRGCRMINVNSNAAFATTETRVS
jgi:hypothetical protein